MNTMQSTTDSKKMNKPSLKTLKAVNVSPLNLGKQADKGSPLTREIAISNFGFKDDKGAASPK